MSPGRLLGLIFLPEIARALAEVRASVSRIARLAGALKPSGQAVVAGGSLLPAGRAGMGLAAAVAAGVGVLVAYGIAGFAGAGAQGIDPGLFASEDSGTRKILSFLTDLSEGTTPVLGEMLFAFNAGVMVFAVFLLLWHIGAAVVDTAREGRLKFGTWEVIRIVVALVMMAPIAGGASAAQYAIFGLAKLGGDFANLVWTPLADKTFGKGRAVVPWPREGEWRAVLGRTLVSEVCMYVANREAVAAGHGEYVTVRTEVERGKPHPNARKRLNRQPPVTAESLHYDGNPRRGLPKDLCGVVRFGGLSEEGARGISARGHRDAWAAVHDLIIMAAKDVGDHFVAGTAVTNQPLPNVSELLDRYTVAASYSTVLELRVKEAGEEGRRDLERRLSEDASKAGWLAAASFVNTLARSAARLQAAAGNLPKAALYSGELGTVSERAKSAVEAVVVNLGKGKGYEPLPLAVSVGIAGLSSVAESRERSLMDRVMNYLDPELVIVADSGNPLLDLANTGALLMNGAMGAMGLLVSLSAGVNVLEGVPIVGKALDAFEASWQVADGLMTPAIGIALIAGAVLLYVLPMIPFVRFLFGILSWLVAVIEGMLAVTVFCAAHVSRGEGNSLATEATREGWLFLPALVLRPVLMLFGLVLGYYLFLVMIGLFNEVWVPRMKDAGGSEGLGLVDYVAMLALYVIVVYGMLNACFKMIDGLPNAVLAWIGGRAAAGGDADDVTGLATGGIGRAAALRMGFRGPSAVRSARQGRAGGAD